MSRTPWKVAALCSSPLLVSLACNKSDSGNQVRLPTTPEPPPVSTPVVAPPILHYTRVLTAITGPVNCERTGAASNVGVPFPDTISVTQQGNQFQLVEEPDDPIDGATLTGTVTGSSFSVAAPAFTLPSCNPNQPVTQWPVALSATGTLDPDGRPHVVNEVLVIHSGDGDVTFYSQLTPAS